MNYQNPYRPANFNVLPVVIKNLLIINVLMFVISYIVAPAWGLDLNDILGLHFPLSQKFRPYQIVTYLFMHGDAMHLISNMFALWMFGTTLENLWGPKRFLIYYVVTGIGAAICHYTVVYFQMQDTLSYINAFIANPSLTDFDAFSNAYGLNLSSGDLLSGRNSHEALQIAVDNMREIRETILNAPLIIGASGAVFGILMAFGVLFPNTYLYFSFLVPIKAKWVVLGYGLLELYQTIVISPGDKVAHIAHLGGMLFGFILLKYWQKQSKRFY